MVNIKIDKKKIASYCRQNHIRRMALFGSALRPDFRKQSDVDILVEFEPGHTPGLNFFRIELELSEMFRRKVDLNTKDFLSPDFRNLVVSEAETVYAKAG